MQMERATIFAELGEAIWHLHLYRASPKFKTGSQTPRGKKLEHALEDKLYVVAEVVETDSSYASLRRLVLPLKKSPPTNALLLAIGLVVYLDYVHIEARQDMDGLVRILGTAINSNRVHGCLYARELIAHLIAARTLEFEGDELHVGRIIRTTIGAGAFLLSKAALNHEVMEQSFEATREKEQKQSHPVSIPNLSAREIYEKLSAHVIGQDDALRAIAARGALHTTKAGLLAANKISHAANECLLLIGDSGCGKTYAASTFGRLCKLPFAEISATDLTSTGYVGMDVDDGVKAVIQDAKDKRTARFGILFVDEIDKTQRSSFGMRDVSGAGLQQCFLRAMEGAEMQVGGKWRRPDEPTIPFNTTGMLFCFAGAFVGLDDCMRRILRAQTGMGFNHSNATIPQNAYLVDALTDFGMLPEFVNRMTSIIQFRPLNFDDLCLITRTEHGPLSYYNEILAADRMAISLADDAVAAMARFALESGTSARGLKFVVGKIVEELLYEDVPRHFVINRADVTRAIGQLPDEDVSGTDGVTNANRMSAPEELVAVQ